MTSTFLGFELPSTCLLLPPWRVVAVSLRIFVKHLSTCIGLPQFLRLLNTLAARSAPFNGSCYSIALVMAMHGLGSHENAREEGEYWHRLISECVLSYILYLCLPELISIVSSRPSSTYTRHISWWTARTTSIASGSWGHYFYYLEGIETNRIHNEKGVFPVLNLNMDTANC